MARMDGESKSNDAHPNGSHKVRWLRMGSIAIGVVLVVLRIGSITAQEHDKHHPAEGDASAPVAAPSIPMSATSAPAAMPGMAPSAPTAPTAAPPGAPSAPGMAGGGMMGEMMGKMAPANSGAPAPAAAGMAGMEAPASPGGCMGGNCGSSAAQTPIYPSLMTLPTLTLEKRAEIDALATQQINEGVARHATGTESLSRATQAGDYAGMQQSVGMMREGLDQLGAGIAARRVLLEGKAPRNLALDWFKREMNLASPIARDGPHAFGVTPFHVFTMGLLIVFALAMVAMYFLKMRRAAALFGRLETGSGGPPPGAAPPVDGALGPSSPIGPPPGTAPPASGPPSPSLTSLTPGVEKPPVLDPLPGPSAVVAAGATSTSPLTAGWRGQLRVGSIVTETPSVKTFRLLPSNNDSLIPFTFAPGQFLNVTFWIGGARMNRSYSISSSPTEREFIDLTVRREPRGAVSRHIYDLLKVGAQIEAGGPVGRFTFSGTEADSIVLIAGGVGITPMMSIARYLTKRSWSGDIFFVYACRAPSDFIFANDLGALQRANPRLRVAVTMDSPEGTDWKGLRGRITKELLAETIPDLASRRVHLCGPPLMMDATKAILTELGVAPAQLKTELFGPTKPASAAAGTTAKLTSPATGPLVTFSKNNKSAKIHIDQTVLELSEELAIAIEFSCRVGTCGVCKVKMTSGEVDMAVDDALEPEDKANNIILACQAKPKVDIAVNA